MNLNKQLILHLIIYSILLGLVVYKFTEPVKTVATSIQTPTPAPAPLVLDTVQIDLGPSNSNFDPFEQLEQTEQTEQTDKEVKPEIKIITEVKTIKVKQPTMLDWLSQQAIYKLLPETILKNFPNKEISEERTLELTKQLQSFEHSIQPRMWHSNVGYFDLQGTLIELFDDEVRLQKTDGKTCCIKRYHLSIADKMYIDKLLVEVNKIYKEIIQ